MFSSVGDLVNLSQFCGAAPCQILAMNRARSEKELIGRMIKIPLNTSVLVTPANRSYVEENGGVRLVKS